MLVWVFVLLFLLVVVRLSLVCSVFVVVLVWFGGRVLALSACSCGRVWVCFCVRLSVCMGVTRLLLVVCTGGLCLVLVVVSLMVLCVFVVGDCILV